jgi:hypothetical protein
MFSSSKVSSNKFLLAGEKMFEGDPNVTLQWTGCNCIREAALSENRYCFLSLHSIGVFGSSSKQACV